MSRYTAHFQAEGWQGDEAVPLDPEGETDWDCTEAVRKYANPDGTLAKPFRLVPGGGYLDNDDVLKDDPAAPQWVRDWRGPFTITVREVT